VVTPADVVEAARAHLGTPWQHQGRLPGVALDCGGLVICVGRELGLLPPDWDVPAYPRHPDGSLMGYCDAVLHRRGAPAPGRVLVLAMRNDPQHLGIVADYRHGGFSIIHAASAAGKVVETRLMFTSNFRLRAVYKFPGVDENGEGA